MSIVTTLRSALVPDVAHIFAYQCELKSLLKGTISPREVADYLDSLDHNTRLASIRSLAPKDLKNLFDAVDGFRKTTIDDVVPREKGERVTVRHYGKNSLPAFTIFEKRFLRPSPDSAELWGFNFNNLVPITGPGYFVARNAPDRGEVDIDYTAVPPEAPSGWPEVQPNEKGISTLVYAHMVDRLRGITPQVSIGRAWKKGKIQSAWFILCRE
jgi:hypothetical protein